MKNNRMDEIKENLKDYILNINDLTAGSRPTIMFYLLAKKLGYLLDPDNNDIVSKEEIYKRECFYKVIKQIGPLFLNNKQVFENRYQLLDEKSQIVDNGIKIPSEPVIYVSNHAFKDDTLATILATKRHPYILFGSLPQFYNTFDGVMSYLNGVIMTNRKLKKSRHASLTKSCEALENGVDLMIFPEGVWNKSPNELILNLWPGVYKIAKETNTKVVPIVHYLADMTGKDKKHQIHTVIDDPIDVSQLNEKEALMIIRNTLASWKYLMMEKYGKTTRQELLNGSIPLEKWEELLKNRVATTNKYDEEIELNSDYRPSYIIRPEEVFDQIANLENIKSTNIQDIQAAKQLIKIIKENDFQRRF